MAKLDLVSALICQLLKQEFQVKEIGSEAVQAFMLEMGKGGYIGSASVSEATLPFELVVTNGETQVLSGRINK
jgi:hypothetical protein